MLPQRYQLLAHLGTGRDGCSYLCLDTETQSQVEVRLLQGVTEASRRRELLVRARRILLTEAPTILAVRDIPEVPEANPAIVVVEAVVARSLQQALDRRVPLSLADLLPLARQISSGLAEAHLFGIIHGQLSPWTIRLTDEGRVVLDFTGLCVQESAPVGSYADFPDDVQAFGQILTWLLTGEMPDPNQPAKKMADSIGTIALTEAELAVANGLHALLREMSDGARERRPNATECANVLRRLSQLLIPTPSVIADSLHVPPAEAFNEAGKTHVSSGPPTPAAVLDVPAQLGRFRILERLGKGGMGTVYKAEDISDGSLVAVKVMNPNMVRNPLMLQRFRKEARMLREVRNPYVANLLEENTQDDVLYIAMEYVAGPSVKDYLAERGRVDEATVLQIAADTARALADAHERGIVHRDIKPDNLIMQSIGENGAFRVRLTDFGLAREINQSAELAMTQGVALGTPLYMAPEQTLGDADVDTRSDVYSLGCTMYHLLSGQPPFLAETASAVMLMHANAPIPDVRKLVPQVSEATAQLVSKAMQKAPADRFADGTDMLAQLERLRRGEPVSLEIHPLLPTTDPKRVLTYEFRWELAASPRQLWPHVSNTERLNRAIGLPAVQFRDEPSDRGASTRYGTIRKAGFVAEWQEHPFEWVEGRRMGVLRLCRRGPLKWLASMVEMVPRPGGGTVLTHRFKAEPNGWLGGLIARWEIGWNARRGLDAVYRRIDAVLTGKITGSYTDAFETPKAMSGQRRRRLERLLEQIIRDGADPLTTEKLGEFLREAPDQEVARIRPLALAARLNVDAESLISVCLRGAHEGLLVLLWDILCPICRIPSQVQETLKALKDHGYCPACNADFPLDFANSVELIFRAHPEIRDAEVKTYCVGGPAHSPHVAAQSRLSPKSVTQVDLQLEEGTYRLGGPQLGFKLDFATAPRVRAYRWDLDVSQPPPAELPRLLAAGGQQFLLSNPTDQELLVRIERRASRGDALTAARAAAMALFRELFPNEVLSSGQLLSVSNVSFLVTDLPNVDRMYAQLGDARAFARFHEYLRRTEDVVRAEAGAIVKALRGGVLAVFGDAVAAVRAARRLPVVFAAQELTREIPIRAGVHRGAVLTATLNDQLDYFGSTVFAALRLPDLGEPGELVMSAAVASDPAVAAELRGCQTKELVTTADLPGEPRATIHRLPLLP